MTIPTKVRNAAGRFNRRVRLERKTAVGPKNSLGEQPFDWTLLKVVWASVRPVSGREYFSQSASTVKHPVTHQIVIRFDAALALTEKDRVSYSGTIYEIEAVLPGDRKEIVLMCSTGVVVQKPAA